LGFDFLAVGSQLTLLQRAFEKGARVHARRRVRLKIHDVAAESVGAGAEEMVEADLEQIRDGGIAGDVPAQLAIGPIGPHDHRQGVPAHDAGQVPLDLQRVLAPWKRRLVARMDSVHIRRVARVAPLQAHTPGRFAELRQQEASPLGPGRLRHALQGFQPFGRLLGIVVAVRIIGAQVLSGQHIHGLSPGLYCYPKGYCRRRRIGNRSTLTKSHYSA